MTQIFAASTGFETWRARLADPEKHWRDGYSAKLTAESWEAAKGLPTEIARLLGAEAILQLALIEHKVPLAGGGADSQCDVFALARADNRDIAMAVEAKVNEPFGPLLSEWFDTPSPGKIKRLRAICEMLGLPDPVATPLSGDLRYQLFHRTAAAVVEARRFHRPVAAMIVQSFAPDHRWFADFAAFCALFGLKAAPQQSAECTLPCGTVLILGWASSATAASEKTTLTGT
jgi:hypothetical protein